MIRAEVSLYPIEQQNADDVITQSIQALADSGVQYSVGPISTEFEGDEQNVWKSLQGLFQRAQSQGGEVSMVCTITNASR